MDATDLETNSVSCWPETSQTKCRRLFRLIFIQSSRPTDINGTTLPAWSPTLCRTASSFLEQDTERLFNLLQILDLCNILKGFGKFYYRIYIDFLVACDFFFSGNQTDVRLFSKKSRQLTHKVLWRLLPSSEDLLNFIDQRVKRHQEHKNPGVQLGMGFRKMITRWYCNRSVMEILLAKRKFKRLHKNIFNRIHVEYTARKLMSSELTEIEPEKEDFFKVMKEKKVSEISAPKETIEAIKEALGSFVIFGWVDAVEELIQRLLEKKLTPEQVVSAVNDMEFTGAQAVIADFFEKVHHLYLKSAKPRDIYLRLESLQKAKGFGESACGGIMSWACRPEADQYVTPIEAWTLLMFVKNQRQLQGQWQARESKKIERLETIVMYDEFALFERSLTTSVVLPSYRRTHVFILHSGRSFLSQTCLPQSDLLCIDAAYLLSRMVSPGSSSMSSLPSGANQPFDFESDLPGDPVRGCSPIITFAPHCDPPGLWYFRLGDSPSLFSFREWSKNVVDEAKENQSSAESHECPDLIKMLSQMKRDLDKENDAILNNVCLWYLTDCRRREKETAEDEEASDDDINAGEVEEILVDNQPFWCKDRTMRFISKKVAKEVYRKIMRSVQQPLMKEISEEVLGSEAGRLAPDLRRRVDKVDPFDQFTRNVSSLSQTSLPWLANIRAVYVGLRDEGDCLEMVADREQVLRVRGFGNYQAQMSVLFSAGVF